MDYREFMVEQARARLRQAARGLPARRWVLPYLPCGEFKRLMRSGGPWAVVRAKIALGRYARTYVLKPWYLASWPVARGQGKS